jgi:hypothetical protein
VLRQIQQAEAEAERTATMALLQAAHTEWRAALAWLERRRPDDWAPKRPDQAAEAVQSEPSQLLDSIWAESGSRSGSRGQAG